MAVNTSQSVTSGQLRAIFAEGRRRGLDHEALRELAGTSSLREITRKDAESVLRRLKGDGFVSLRTIQHRRQVQGVEQVVRKPQIALIAKLASQRDWSPETLMQFCRRQCGYIKPRTTKDANKLIEALRAMNRRDGLWAN